MFNFEELIKKYEEQVLAWYTHLHQYPEPSFHEEETTKFIIEELEKMGVYELSRPSKTGVVADLKGGKPGKTIALRADIDALCMEELGDAPFKSKKEGLMHGCGHDSHISMLLGVARILADLKDELPGNYRLLFQPAEEVLPGGAIEYVKAGVLDGVDYILGQHVMPHIPTGQFGLIGGPIMAASDCFFLTVKGRGGHASQPHLNIDAITTGAQIVSNLQHICSRETDPLAQVVISVTQFNGGTAHNVMPQKVKIVGSVRTFDEKVRQHAVKRIEEISRLVAEANRCTIDFKYEFGYDATVNNEEVTDMVRDIIRDRWGDEALPKIIPLMGGEDFSRYLKVVPGTFYFLGIGNAGKGYTYPIHHGCFRVDTDALPLGIEVMLRGATTLAIK